jgi:predicted HTH domain antitoxin
MSERVINISFPIKENILISLKETKEQFTKEMLYSTALVLYRKHKLSLGKSAEFAGYSKIDFIKKLQGENEFIFDYTDDEIDEIFSDSKITL